jgi:hypothetical protein
MIIFVWKKLFDCLVKCKNDDENNKYIEIIKKMIVDLNGF